MLRTIWGLITSSFSPHFHSKPILRQTIISHINIKAARLYHIVSFFRIKSQLRISQLKFRYRCLAASHRQLPPGFQFPQRTHSGSYPIMDIKLYGFFAIIFSDICYLHRYMKRFPRRKRCKRQPFWTGLWRPIPERGIRKTISKGVCRTGYTV